MPPINLSLQPYTDNYGLLEASHLVRRINFNFNQQLRDEVFGLGLVASVDKITEVFLLPDKPLNSETPDLLVPIGSTWVGTIYSNATEDYRRQSLFSWTAEQLSNPILNIREKMVLFWHNHFAIRDVNDPHYLFEYSNTLRSHALGNFKELTKAITIDPSMLRFLNGNSNTAGSPNENYARELLELFTIGKGPLAAPGDYTNYTELDVEQISKILTGWRDLGYRGAGLQLPDVAFFPGRHDTGIKQLSHRFNNATVSNMGEYEYSHLIDILFLQDEVARYICRKLYRYFVFYEITEEIEENIIVPLAQTFVANNYEIIPVLKQLFLSEHFYDENLMGCQIKNPYEFILPIFSTLKSSAPSTLKGRYDFNAAIFFGGTLLDMNYYQIPQVAGWKAYYQEPIFNRYWINNVTLGLRKVIVDLVVTVGVEADTDRIRPDLLAFVASLSQPADVNQLIDDAAKLIFTQPLASPQIDFFKEILIPGLPDFEWTVEYNNYLADPTNQSLALAITLRLNSLFTKMLNSPDFHLQ